jgi:hypothetical protein
MTHLMQPDATKLRRQRRREHTLVAICYMQLQHNAKTAGKHSEKKVTMNLVDLAGSERAEPPQTGRRHQLKPLPHHARQRHQRACGEEHSPKTSGLVPYHESKLSTVSRSSPGRPGRQQQDHHICALAPANINLEATLDTL